MSEQRFLELYAQGFATTFIILMSKVINDRKVEFIMTNLSYSYPDKTLNEVMDFCIIILIVSLSYRYHMFAYEIKNEMDSKKLTE